MKFNGKCKKLRASCISPLFILLDLLRKEVFIHLWQAFASRIPIHMNTVPLRTSRSQIQLPPLHASLHPTVPSPPSFIPTHHYPPPPTLAYTPHYSLLQTTIPPQPIPSFITPTPHCPPPLPATEAAVNVLEIGKSLPEVQKRSDLWLARDIYLKNWIWHRWWLTCLQMELNAQVGQI